MSEIILYAFVLMIGALLLGFIIGWGLRRATYQSRYETQIEELSHDEQHITSELNQNTIKIDETKKRLTATEETYSNQRTVLSEHQEKSQQLKNELDELSSLHDTLEDDIHAIDGKITSSADALEILNSQKEEMLGYQNEIAEYQSKINAKNEEIEATKFQISELISERDSLTAQISNLDSIIVQKEDEIKVFDQTISEIEKEFETKTNEILPDVNMARNKALNYQYAVEYIQEKMGSDESVSFDVVDKIISKNEEKGIFANIKQKLFGKRALYVKGDK